MWNNINQITPNGSCFIICQAVIHHEGRKHDLILEWRRRDGIWDRDCVGLTPTLVSSLHEFEVMPAASSSLKIKGRIAPDTWTVVGGMMDLLVTLTGDRPPFDAGTYSGSFSKSPIDGPLRVEFKPAAHVSRGVWKNRPDILGVFEKEGAKGRLYDFSFAGRDTRSPSPTLPIFDASDFGVRADSGMEALKSIQAALDAAGAAGGGIVQLPAGVLDCNVDCKLPPLRIRHSNVILRGAGSTPDGTILVNHRYSDTPDPDEPWRAGEHPLLIIGPEDLPEPQPLTRAIGGARGENVIQVNDASNIQPGHNYLLRQLESPDGSLALALVQGQVKVAKSWQGAGNELVSQLVTVLAVDGNSIRIDAPLHRNIDHWHAELCIFPMIQKAGIEALRMRGMWGGFFIHHKNGEHDNGWDQVKFLRVCAGWASDLVHENTTSALGLKDCLGCVVSGCRISGNPGHNGFILGGRSTGNLFINCHAARNMHGFNVQGTICGNAIVDCSMDEAAGIDLHGGIGCDNLLDALVGGVNRGGGSTSAVPPRHGPGMVLWNWCCGHYDPYKVWQRYDLVADHRNTPGFIAVGVHGVYGQAIHYNGPEGLSSGALSEAWGWVESPGQRVAPRSLFAWQCERRHVSKRF